MNEGENYRNKADTVYRTRKPGDNQSLEFQQKLAEAIVYDLAQFIGEEVPLCYPFEDEGNSANNLPCEEGEASDEEDQLIVETIIEDEDNNEQLHLVIEQSKCNEPAVVLSTDIKIKEKNVQPPSSDKSQASAAGPSVKSEGGGGGDTNDTEWNLNTRNGPTFRSHMPHEIFKNLITPEMVFIIINETNRKALKVVNKYNAKHRGGTQKTWTPLTEVEFYAYLGILLASGVTNNNFQNISELWNTKNLPIFRASLSLQRFLAISRFIRFDNGNTRQARLQANKAAAISEIWYKLNENLQNAYIPNGYITFDEQFFPYRGRTRFTQFVPSQPEKYGLNVYWAVDSQSYYPLKGLLYRGKNPYTHSEERGQLEKRCLMAFSFKYNMPMLFSTMHNYKDRGLFYNENKFGENSMGQILNRYTTYRQTKRWSLAFFYNMIDIAALATYIICNDNVGLTGIDSRRNFLIRLSELLAIPHMQRRMDDAEVMRHYNTRSGIECFFARALEYTDEPAMSGNVSNLKHVCTLCTDRRRSRFICHTCKTFCCLTRCQIVRQCLSCYTVGM